MQSSDGSASPQAFSAVKTAPVIERIRLQRRRIPSGRIRWRDSANTPRPLSLGDRTVFDAFCRFAATHGNRTEFTVSNREIAGLACVSEDTVERAIPRLMRAGVLVRTFRPGARERFTKQSSQYVLPRWVSVEISDAPKRAKWNPTAPPTPKPLPPATGPRETFADYMARKASLDLGPTKDRPAATPERQAKLKAQVEEVKAYDAQLEAKRQEFKRIALEIDAADGFDPEDVARPIPKPHVHVQPASCGPSPVFPPPKGEFIQGQHANTADALPRMREYAADAANTVRIHVFCAGTGVVSLRAVAAANVRNAPPSGAPPPFPFPTHPPDPLRSKEGATSPKGEAEGRWRGRTRFDQATGRWPAAPEPLRSPDSDVIWRAAADVLNPHRALRPLTNTAGCYVFAVNTNPAPNADSESGSERAVTAANTGEYNAP